jgi:hypothetical protein
MARLFGQELSGEQLRQRVGCLSQIAGASPFRFAGGRADGVRAVGVRTGSGLSFVVLLDRGLDIAQAEYCGQPIGWISKNGIVGPAHFEPQGFGWLRSFGGGLLTTCGLTQVGAPCTDSGEALGLHGRISHLPAENFSIAERWEADEYVIRVAGLVRESCLYQENLVLRREISCRLGGSTITIDDIVENQGYNDTPFMILYHYNFGFPVISEHTRLYSSAVGVEPWNEEARAGNRQHDRFEQPTPGYAYQVFTHEMPRDQNKVYAALVNEPMAFGAYLAFRPQELPCFSEWKMMGQQDYVVGLEPGTNGSEGRAEARQSGRLIVLRPGETRTMSCEIGVLAGRQEIDALLARVSG